MQHGLKCKKEHKLIYIKDVYRGADNEYKITIEHKNTVDRCLWLSVHRTADVRIVAHHSEEIRWGD